MKYYKIIEIVMEIIVQVILFLIVSILFILRQIVKVLIRNPIISLLLIFGIWINSLPLPDENFVRDASGIKVRHSSIKAENTNQILLKKFEDTTKNDLLMSKSKDIYKIEQASVFKRDYKIIEPDDENENFDLNQKEQTLSSTSSIFVDAFQSIAHGPRFYGSSNTITNPIFKSVDSTTGKKIPDSMMLQAHVACLDQVSKLPRKIEKKDRTVKMGSFPYFESLFKRNYKSLDYSLSLVTPDGEVPVKKKKIRQAERLLFQKYEDQARVKLRELLFENPIVVKTTQCRYRHHKNMVTVYYSYLYANFFAIVDSKTNELLEFGIASDTDYADVFNYRSIFQGKTASEMESSGMECPSSGENPFKPGQCSESDLFKEAIIKFKSYDHQINRGLPEEYNIII